MGFLCNKDCSGTGSNTTGIAILKQLLKAEEKVCNIFLSLQPLSSQLPSKPHENPQPSTPCLSVYYLTNITLFLIVAYARLHVLYFDNFFQFAIITRYNFGFFSFCAKILLERILTNFTLDSHLLSSLHVTSFSLGNVLVPLQCNCKHPFWYGTNSFTFSQVGFLISGIS